MEDIIKNWKKTKYYKEVVNMHTVQCSAVCAFIKPVVKGEHPEHVRPQDHKSDIGGKIKLMEREMMDN